ncbi:hypothetical protein ACVMB1_006049 [Bradyrhizobium sp. USDA 4504]
MKNVLSVVTFSIGALCFAVFLTMLRPQPTGAVTQPDRPAYCRLAAFWCVGLP